MMRLPLSNAPRARGLTAAEESFLLSAAESVVPETRSFGAEDRREFLEILRGALNSRPPAEARLLRAYMLFLRARAFALHGRPWGRLGERARDAFLRRAQESRVHALRQGFFGLRTLIFMGYYGRPSAGEAIGYRRPAGSAA